ncbi:MULTISPECIES: hypothetical protein [unclassified Microbacterium]|uniref:hypothetical protein n=1 Tax=unclassified Microbacterium TaxID=2609290 RepID=UPI00342BF655
MPPRDTGRRFRRLKGEFRTECERDDEPCWLCGQRIDYTVPDWSTDDSFSLDHYFPVSTHPHLQTDPAGFRAAHTDCNRRRSNRAPHPGLGRVSRSWF